MSLLVKFKGSEHILDFFILSHRAATIQGLPYYCQLIVVQRVDTFEARVDPVRGGAKEPWPPKFWIIMIHNLFKVGKCIGSKYEGPFFFGSLPLQ